MCRVQSPSGLALVSCALSMVDLSGQLRCWITHTEKCFVFRFWHPMLVRPAMKRFFCLKAKNGLIKIGTNTSAVSSTVSGSKPVVVSTSQTQKKKWSRSYAGHFHFHCVCVDYSNKLFYTMIFFSRSHTISSICYSGRKRALRKTACLPN